jgi:hypothetical protein
MDKNTDGEDTNMDSNMNMDRHGQDMDTRAFIYFLDSKIGNQRLLATAQRVKNKSLLLLVKNPSAGSAL